jgi:dephospho-CoA kinase
MAIAEKVNYADVVVDNSGSLLDLEDQVDRLLAQLRKEVGWTWRLSWLIPPFGSIVALWVLVRRAFTRWITAQRKKKR